MYGYLWGNLVRSLSLVVSTNTEGKRENIISVEAREKERKRRKRRKLKFL